MDISSPTAPQLSPDIKKERKKYTGVALRILNLLIGQATQEQAATAVGVSPSLVSQLCSEEDFMEQVVEGMKTNIESAIDIDKTYIEIEHSLVVALKKQIPFVINTDQILRILRQVNSARMRTNPVVPQTGINGTDGSRSSATPVRLFLPTFIHNTFIMNPNQEIVGIGDRSLVTLDSKKLHELSSKPRLPKPKELKELEIPREQYQRHSDPWSEL